MAHRLVPIALAFLLIVSCGKKEETTSPAPAPAPAPASTTSSATTPAPAPATSAPAPAAVAGGIASADADKPGVKVTITELKRSAGGTLSLKAVISNGSDDSYGFGGQFEEPGHGNDYGTIGGVSVVDPVGKKKYFVARDSDGHPLCSSGLEAIKQGGSANLWAKFAAPPDDVQKVTVVFPHFQPLDDVPISK